MVLHNVRITGELEPTILNVVCTMMWGFLVGEY